MKILCTEFTLRLMNLSRNLYCNTLVTTFSMDSEHFVHTIQVLHCASTKNAFFRFVHNKSHRFHFLETSLYASLQTVFVKLRFATVVQVFEQQLSLKFS